MTPFPKIEAYIRTLILYPVAMSFIVTGTIWSWMYQDQGVINNILKSLGFELSVGFTNDANAATYWIVFIFVWQYLGFSVIIVYVSLSTAVLYVFIEENT